MGAINCIQPISYTTQSILLKLQRADCVEPFAKIGYTQIL